MTPVPTAAITAVAVLVQPAESVMVTVYVPDVSPVADALVPPEGSQLYVRVPVPPLAVTVAVPLLFPQLSAVTLITVAMAAG